MEIIGFIVMMGAALWLLHDKLDRLINELRATRELISPRQYELMNKLQEINESLSSIKDLLCSDSKYYGIGKLESTLSDISSDVSSIKSDIASK